MNDVAPSSGPRDLVAVMAFDPLSGLGGLEAALDRLKVETAAAGMAFDRHAVRNELQAATFRLRGACSVRLLVGRGGATAIEVTPAS